MDRLDLVSPDGTEYRDGITAFDREAAAETEAGFGIPIGEIERWIQSWDTPDELPMPQARRIL